MLAGQRPELDRVVTDKGGGDERVLDELLEQLQNHLARREPVLQLDVVLHGDLTQIRYRRIRCDSRSDGVGQGSVQCHGTPRTPQIV